MRRNRLLRPLTSDELDHALAEFQLGLPAQGLSSNSAESRSSSGSRLLPLTLPPSCFRRCASRAFAAVATFPCRTIAALDEIGLDAAHGADHRAPVDLKCFSQSIQGEGLHDWNFPFVDPLKLLSLVTPGGHAPSVAALPLERTFYVMQGFSRAADRYQPRCFDVEKPAASRPRFLRIHEHVVVCLLPVHRR
jgi:hypothetical protein